MNRRIRRAATALAVVLTLATAAACSESDPPTAHDDYGTVTPGVPDAGSVDQVFTQALSTIYSWQPTSDRSPTDALIRAKGFLTGDALRAAESDGVVRPSAEWGAWARSGDVVTVAIANAHTIDRVGGAATGSAVVTQTVLHRDGSTTPYATFTVTAELRDQGGWKLATYPTRQ